MNTELFNRNLIRFLQHSPTPFHCVENMVNQLEENDFELLSEENPWHLHIGGRYMVTRNDSAIIAFVMGADDPDRAELRLVGAHTDSPCLKVKPEPDITNAGYRQIGVEIYGGALLAPWFDRDLSIAGRISYRDKRGGVSSVLINLVRPVASIPSLAIHLDREVNKNRSINPQTQVVPILGLSESNDDSFRDIIMDQLAEEYGQLDIDLLLDYDLCLYDTQAPAFIGFKNELLASARLDNLLSCYTGLRAIENAEQGEHTSILACYDHEEVGSVSTSGAQSPFLSDVIDRIYPARETRSRAFNRSLMISADNAHAVHPNFIDKHDANHLPVINGGPVIKFNANQRYATSSETAALFRNLCIETGVPIQTIAMRNDMACGSTIGPISAAELGIPVVDVGIPQWAMHSIREMCGDKDAFYLYKVLQTFFKT
jgi:aspartyl aminopeptidase